MNDESTSCEKQPNTQSFPNGNGALVRFSIAMAELGKTKTPQKFTMQPNV